MALGALGGCAPSLRELAVECSRPPRHTVADPCARLAGSSTPELAALRVQEEAWIDAPLVSAVTAGTRGGVDHRSVFDGREPGSVAWQHALEPLDREQLLYPAYGLALLCRTRCRGYRVALQERLHRWTATDWSRASAAAAALGFLGSADSESVLLTAAEQRRSHLLAMAAMRALGRLESTSPVATERLSKLAVQHWSARAREVAADVLSWRERGGGYRLVTEAISSAVRPRGRHRLGISLFELGDELEPTMTVSAESRDDPGRGWTMYLRDRHLESEPDPTLHAFGCFDRPDHSTSRVRWGGKEWVLAAEERLPEPSRKSTALIRGSSPDERWKITYGFGRPSVVWFIRGRHDPEPVAELALTSEGWPIRARAVDSETLIVVTSGRALVVTPAGVQGSACDPAGMVPDELSADTGRRK